MRPTAMSFVARWFDRLQPSESVVLGGAALAVGLTSGAGVWLFKRLIDGVHAIAFDGIGGVFNSLGGWTIAVVPITGGLIVGLLLHFFVGEERHHGVAGIMEAVARRCDIARIKCGWGHLAKSRLKRSKSKPTRRAPTSASRTSAGRAIRLLQLCGVDGKR